MYSLHPLLLIYSHSLGSERKFVAQIYESQPTLIINDYRVAWGLSLLPKEFDKKIALDLWKARNELSDIYHDIWNICLTEKLIIDIESYSSKYKLWSKYSWNEAFLYHESTKDYPFIKMDTHDAFYRDDQRMVAYAKEESVPQIYLEVDSVFQIEMRKLSKSESIDGIVSAMDKEERRGRDGLGLLFDVCFGERKKVPFKIQGDFLRKSVPSGGARHPTEVFFVSFSGSPFEEGIYHYNVKNHRLDAIKKGDFYNDFEYATFDLFKKFDSNPVGLFIFSSLWERAMWRYRDARSWRAPLIDVGHAVMAYRTMCDALGFGNYTYQKFRDENICELLGINEANTTPLFLGTLV